ncbi:hypothetical protein B0H66DRAFT_165800 [Apodospora peruviana]|uniref:Secreted protein n=1 Tax=Apodospora peruviana TaxID=516989 RepID=A0AAE0MCF4_9PEZI|nr:hypothetical protein B0H66DRAFT_165800 [Apodospora peruviana]
MKRHPHPSASLLFHLISSILYAAHSLHAVCLWDGFHSSMIYSAANCGTSMNLNSLTFFGRAKIASLSILALCTFSLCYQTRQPGRARHHYGREAAAIFHALDQTPGRLAVEGGLCHSCVTPRTSLSEPERRHEPWTFGEPHVSTKPPRNQEKIQKPPKRSLQASLFFLLSFPTGTRPCQDQWQRTMWSMTKTSEGASGDVDWLQLPDRACHGSTHFSKNKSGANRWPKSR